MPIILLWNAAALPFERQVKHWLKELDRYGSLVGKWLGKRLEKAEGVERQSRGFPVVLFYNLALTARLSPFQQAALLPAGPPGLGESFARIGAAWDLPGAWNTRKEEAKLLPRLFAALARITAASRASVARLKDAPPEMFTPGNLTAVDLVGLASLTFRSVGQGREGILEAGKRLHATLFETDARVGSAAGTAGGSGGGGALPLAMQLDNLLYLIAGGLVAVPATVALFQKVGGDVVLWIKHTVMKEIVGIERKVLDFRQSLLGGINAGLQQFAYVAVGMLVIMREQAADFMRHYILFTSVYVDGLSRGIETFFDQFRALWSGIRRIIEDTMGFLGKIAKLDLGPVLHAVFVVFEKAVRDLNKVFTLLSSFPLLGGGMTLGTVMRLFSYSAPDEFKITVEEFVLNKPSGAKAHAELQKGLKAVTGSLHQLSLFGITTDRIERQLRSKGYDLDIDGILSNTKTLLEELQQDPVKQGKLPPLLDLKTGDLPDIDKQFLEPARKAILKGLTEGGNAMRQGAEDLNVNILDFLDSTAVTFAAAADDAAVSQLGVSIPGLRKAAEKQVLANFPSGELRIKATGLEPLAEAYKAWLVQSAPMAGMQMTGAAITGYLTFVLDEWESRIANDADTPVAVTETSPRILLEKARLGRVYLPKLVISATGHETDTQLASRIADEFRIAVGAAYASGHAKLKGYAASARAREAATAAAAKAGPAPATAVPAEGGGG